MNITALQPVSSAGAAAAPRSPAVSAAGSFGDMLASLGAQAIDSIKASEATSMAALQGQASVQDVVMKTLAAEQSLQAALAVRDKLVTALNNLTQMQI